MGRRRSSAPSSLILIPATIPLIRGAPKFILPSPPSNQAIHLSDHRRMKPLDHRSDLGPLKPMPRLEFPIGIYGFGSPLPSSGFLSPNPLEFRNRQEGLKSSLSDLPSISSHPRYP